VQGNIRLGEGGTVPRLATPLYASSLHKLT